MIQRGDVCWGDFGPIIDRAPAKRRPVVVVQNDEYIRTPIGTVVVAALSGKIFRAKIPGNVYVPHFISGLERDSVVLTTELMSVDRDSLGTPVGRLPEPVMNEVSAGLRRVLDL